MDQNEIDSYDRLDRLAQGGPGQSGYNPVYSKFIRWMRLLLPVVATVILAVVFIWMSLDKQGLTPAEDEKIRQTISKNELLAPRFESTDEKGQPYTMTATRAVQNEADKTLVVLEAPEASIALNDGSKVSVRAKEGNLWQEQQKLLLQNNVSLSSDKGYVMNMEKLDIDIGKSQAVSDSEIKGYGPEGTLTATGLDANSATNVLIFKGPAKLVLDKLSSDKKIIP